MSKKNMQGRGARDANHDPIVADYRACGCSVFETTGVGFGFPDLVVGCVLVTELVEIKISDGTPTKAQEVFDVEWRGSKVVTVRTRDDVLAHVLQMRAKARAMERGRV